VDPSAHRQTSQHIATVSAPAAHQQRNQPSSSDLLCACSLASGLAALGLLARGVGFLVSVRWRGRGCWFVGGFGSCLVVATRWQWCCCRRADFVIVGEVRATIFGSGSARRLMHGVTHFAGVSVAGGVAAW